jgi:hypothetical protein
MDPTELDYALTEAFAVTGASTPPWPDPHPDRNPPEEAYSRLLDPAKYRILGARAEAWIAALTHEGLADAEEVTDPNAAWREKPTVPLTRAVRLRARRPGTVPLLLGFAGLQGVPDAVVLVGAGEPAVQFELIPDCGCDACDSGSQDLLDTLDRLMHAVVSGDLVHVTTPKGTAFSTGSGYSARGFRRRTDIHALLDDARAGRSRHDVVRGAPWW